MNIIPLRLHPSVDNALKKYAAQMGIDTGLMLDTYAVLRGAPLLSAKAEQSAVSQLVPTMGGIMSSIMVKKRMQYLKACKTDKLFNALSRAANPVQAVVKYFKTLNKISNQTRAAQCVTCQHFKACAFGKQYEPYVSDISKVVDPDYKAKIHPDCPSLPRIEDRTDFFTSIMNLRNMLNPKNANTTAALAASVDPNADAEELQEAIEEEDPDELIEVNEEEDGFMMPEDASGGDTNMVDNSLPSMRAKSYIKLVDTMIEQLGKSSCIIFELARQLDILLAKSREKEMQEAKKLTEETKERQIRTVSESLKTTSLEHAMPQEINDAKTANKTLVTRNFIEPKPQKKHLVYLLLDASGSMRCKLNGVLSVLTREGMSKLLSISLVNRVKQEGGIVYVRFFAGSSTPLVSAKNNSSEFDDLKTIIADTDFDGGSTNIQGALTCAFKDVESASSELRKAEILLITDGISELNIPVLSKLKASANVKLNCIVIQESYSYGDLGKLKSLSDKYYVVDNNTTLDNLVKLG